MRARTLGWIAGAAAMLGLAANANALIVVEEYTGQHSLNEGESVTFDFDMWYENEWPVNDNSSLRLTTDGVGAVGKWLSATLYIDFWSEDSDRDYADIDFWAWQESPSGPKILDLNSVNVSRPSGWDKTYNFTWNLGSLSVLDDYGWGSLRVKASSRSGLTNDLRIDRVGLKVVTADGGGGYPPPPVPVPEPASLALLGLGLAGLGFVARRRRAN